MAEAYAPQTIADARLVLGAQRSGKNSYGVASVKDDYYKNLNGLIVPNNSGQVINAKQLTQDDWKNLKTQGVKYHPFRYVKVFSDDWKKSKIIEIPKGYMVKSPVRIFTNFHLFGMKFWYITIADIIEHLNDEVFTDGWLLSDETSLADARFSMTLEGKEMAQFMATIGKRNLHFLQLTQYNEMVERRFRLFGTSRVLCHYEPITKTVTCDISKKGEPDKQVSFYLPWYWHNFRTNERIPVSDTRIRRALQKIAG